MNYDIQIGQCLIAIFLYATGSVLSTLRSIASLQKVIDDGEPVLPVDEADYGSRIALLLILFCLSWFGFVLGIISYFVHQEKHFFLVNLKNKNRGEG